MNDRIAKVLAGHAPPAPIPQTIADHLHRGQTLAIVVCDDCGHRSRLDLVMIAERHGADTELDDVSRVLACSCCLGRNPTVEVK